MTAYSKSTWNAGETIDAARLNNLETQYASVTADYGPFYYTVGATSDTLLFTDTATYTASISPSNGQATIHVPGNILPSVVRFSAEMKSTGTGAYCYIWRLNNLTSAVNTPSTVINIFLVCSSLNWSTMSSGTATVYPGEILFISPYVGGGTGYLRNLKIYGLISTPSTSRTWST